MPQACENLLHSLIQVKPFMGLLSEHDIPITFGSDAHDLEHIGFGREITYALAKEYGYTQCVTFQKQRPVVD